MSASRDEYHSLSIAAIVGLLLGLASVLAFVHYLLLLVPVLAIVVCGYALLEIRRYEPHVTGRKAAMIGICLAVALGTGAIVKTTSHRLAIEHEAARVGTSWIELVRSGQLEKAHQLTLDSYERLAPSADLKSAYAELPDLQTKLAEFKASPIVNELSAPGRTTHIVVDRLELFHESQDSTYVPATYEVDTIQDGKSQKMVIGLRMYRVLDRRIRQLVWQIIPVKNVDTKSNSSAETDSSDSSAIVDPAVGAPSP